MNSDDFWRMIDGVLDLPFDARAARLVDLLAARAEGDITGFEDRLAEALHRLDTPAHAVAHGDAFLYIRCAAVLSGSRAHQRIVEDPRSLLALADVEAEELLFVASTAYERVTDRPWEHRAPVSYESGTSAAWGRPVEDGTDEWQPEWLSWSGGYGLGVQMSAEYELTRLHLVEALDATEGWRQWWSAAPAPQADVTFVVDPGMPEQTKVRKGRKVVRAEVVRDRHGFASAPAATEPEKARDDLVAVLTITAEQLRMPAMPQFPPMPVLSEEELRNQCQGHEESAAIDRMAAELVARHLGQGVWGAMP
ncbi:hypothetical protein GCM10009827_057980 [Dactylosporangium maewongense]|uniref:DUF4240 domain-containing protein n=1 Tax=Dactylosporangium maewongense TaxID=634393 RepID=A0ABP4LVD7_9ACTN